MILCICTVSPKHSLLSGGSRGGLLEPPSYPPFLNILWKWNNLVSMRLNYFIFMRYVRKMGTGAQQRIKGLAQWRNAVPPTSLAAATRLFISYISRRRPYIMNMFRIGQNMKPLYAAYMLETWYVSLTHISLATSTSTSGWIWKTTALWRESKFGVLWIPTFVVLIQAHKVIFTFRAVEVWYLFYSKNERTFWPQIYTTNVRMQRQ